MVARPIVSYGVFTKYHSDWKTPTTRMVRLLPFFLMVCLPNIILATRRMVHLIRSHALFAKHHFGGKSQPRFSHVVGFSHSELDPL